jgi:hypothetical protein
MKRGCLLFLILALLLIPPHAVLAGSGSSCSFQSDGSIECVMSGETPAEGGGGGGNGGNPAPAEPTPCDPGEVKFQYVPISFDPATNTCTVMAAYFSCGILVEGGETQDNVPCSSGASPASDNPCTRFTINSGGITCEMSQWNIRARVPFPEIFLDVRPYPATLVRWPTALRNGGLPSSSGSGRVGYVPNGGGSPGNPQEGDWRNVRLTLTLQAAGSMYVTLPHIGSLQLADQGATGTPTQIRWEVPSHPSAGGGPLAGNVSALDDLPGDMPLFVGMGRAPYRLFWELRYAEYMAKKGCVAGPDEGGRYTCGGGTGHREVIGYEWKRQSDSGEIPPTAVQNLPSSFMADVNGDGTPESYWDNNLTLRRMDDNNRVDNPRYQRSWNWGGIIYWAVREGQGQIGWPGQ